MAEHVVVLAIGETRRSAARAEAERALADGCRVTLVVSHRHRWSVPPGVRVVRRALKWRLRSADLLVVTDPASMPVALSFGKPASGRPVAYTYEGAR
jgi:hypothetical protein